MRTSKPRSGRAYESDSRRDHRGRPTFSGDLLNTYFDEAEARSKAWELYSEWEALASLTGEALERQKQNANVVFKVVKMLKNGGIRL